LFSFSCGIEIVLYYFCLVLPQSPLSVGAKWPVHLVSCCQTYCSVNKICLNANCIVCNRLSGLLLIVKWRDVWDVTNSWSRSFLGRLVLSR
jgi:hypothetical protein